MPRRLRTLAERLDEGIDRSGGPDACHPWTRYVNRRGYGEFVWRDVLGDGRWHHRNAHRVAYEQHHGVTVPADLVVRHDCDYPTCCNVRHLRIGTHTDNMADRLEHGAGYVRGEQHLNAVVDDRTVAEIRAAYRPGVRGAGTWALADRFGISRSQMQRIVTWESRVPAD